MLIPLIFRRISFVFNGFSKRSLHIEHNGNSMDNYKSFKINRHLQHFLNASYTCKYCSLLTGLTGIAQIIRFWLSRHSHNNVIFCKNTTHLAHSLRASFFHHILHSFQKKLCIRIFLVLFLPYHY